MTGASRKIKSVATALVPVLDVSISGSSRSRNYDLALRASRQSIKNEKDPTDGEDRSKQVRESNQARAPHEQFHETLRVDKPVMRWRIDQPTPFSARTNKKQYASDHERDAEESVEHT